MADTGVLTTIEGTLLVAEQADFTANLDANLGLDVSGADLTVTGQDITVSSTGGLISDSLHKVDKYGSYLFLTTATTTGSSTVAKGVAMTGDLTVDEGVADLSTKALVPRMVAQATLGAAATGWFQYAGIAEVQLTATVSVGDSVKWNVSQQVCPMSTDLGTGVEETVMGTVVSMKDRAGNVWASTGDEIQVLMGSPESTLLPA